MNKLLKIFKTKIYFDQYLFISITLLSIMGLIFLYSASQGNIETTIKQSFFVALGLVLMFLLSQVDPDFYKNNLELSSKIAQNGQELIEKNHTAEIRLNYFKKIININ